MATAPLIIKGWEQGMANSPHEGIGLIRNADIESFPGAVKVAKKPGSFFFAGQTVTFTANASTDVCTASGTIETNSTFDGMAVYFTTTGTLPAGLSTGTVYFLIKVSSTTFKVATSYKNSAGSSAGTAIDITDTGTGTHTMNPLTAGTINWIVKDYNTGYLWMLDSRGRSWFQASAGSKAYLFLHSSIESPSGSLTNASGQGLVLFKVSNGSKTYMFTFRNSLIDVIDITDTTAIETPAWSDAWQTMNAGAGSGTSHHAIVGQDNIIYYCDDRFIGSILEKAGSVFAPGTASTYTYNSQALDLSQGEVAQCLEELGINLLIGGNTYNKIYPWDRISDSFNLPITCPEMGIKRMKNIGNIVYILSGTWGNIYTTQGSYVKFFRKIPTYITNNESTILSNPVVWGGIASVNGSLLFGLNAELSGSDGVYRLYDDGRLIHDNYPSTGSKTVVGLYADSEFYIMGYNGGADNFSVNAALYSSFETIIQSALYKVGDATSKATYSELEIQLAKPASSGHIRVGYRNNTSGSFTTITTFTANGTSTSLSADAGLTDIENIQFQVEMDGSVELMELRLS